jgi:hypothetical protein
VDSADANLGVAVRCAVDCAGRAHTKLAEGVAAVLAALERVEGLIGVGAASSRREAMDQAQICGRATLRQRAIQRGIIADSEFRKRLFAITAVAEGAQD